MVYRLSEHIPQGTPIPFVRPSSLDDSLNDIILQPGNSFYNLLVNNNFFGNG